MLADTPPSLIVIWPMIIPQNQFPPDFQGGDSYLFHDRESFEEMDASLRGSIFEGSGCQGEREEELHWLEFNREYTLLTPIMKKKFDIARSRMTMPNPQSFAKPLAFPCGIIAQILVDLLHRKWELKIAWLSGFVVHHHRKGTLRFNQTSPCKLRWDVRFVKSHTSWKTISSTIHSIGSLVILHLSDFCGLEYLTTIPHLTKYPEDDGEGVLSFSQKYETQELRNVFLCVIWDTLRLLPISWHLIYYLVV